MKQYFKIIGSARTLPNKCITAEELDQRNGLPKGWTIKHTGVRLRYEAVEPENGITLGRLVILDALRSAGLKVADLELLVDASLSLQQPIPSNSALLQESLGLEASGCATMDIHSSCMGFIVALQAVNGLFAAGAYQRAVIVCAETPLRGVNWHQPESSHLMGDGAAAVVVEACPPDEDCTFSLQTFGAGAQFCRVQGGGHRLTPLAYSLEKHARYLFDMDGKGVHKFASRYLPPMVQGAIAKEKIPFNQLHVIPHQASGPSIELLARRLRIRRERLFSSIESHGNLVSAGIPFVLHAARAQLRAGARTMLIGTAAGYSQAVAIFSL